MIDDEYRRSERERRNKVWMKFNTCNHQDIVLRHEMSPLVQRAQR